jgi:hypothetical protein
MKAVENQANGVSGYSRCRIILHRFGAMMSTSKLFDPECMCLNGGRRVDEVFAAFSSLHSQNQLEDEREAGFFKLAFEQVRTRIQERGRWCGHFGLAENAEQFYSQEPSPLRFGGIEWEIHRFLWRPWLIQFREGRWIAKGRALDFSAERNEIPTAFFYSHVEFDMSRSAIEENIDTGTKFVMGTRYVDVMIYSREYLEHQAASHWALSSGVAQVQTEASQGRGGRPVEKPIEQAFYRAIARYRRDGLPENKTRLVEDIIDELEAINEHAGPSTVRDWLVKYVKPFYEACSLPMNFDKKDE